MPKYAAAPAAKSGKWYEITARGAREAELFIFGDIGESWWNDESITARKLVNDLAALGEIDYLIVRINSYGGSVSDGLAIYNALKRHDAAVTVVVEGVAVSIASLIAMAGDTVQMAANSLFMVHAPWGQAVGNAGDMRDMADVLDRYAHAMAQSYVAKTGMTEDDVLALLTDGADHWYSAAEAQAAGFIDEIVEDLAVAASLPIPSRFNPPAGLGGHSHTPAVAAGINPKEIVMPDDKKTPAAEPQAKPAADTNVVQIEAAAREREQARLTDRNKEIRAIFTPFIAREGMADVLNQHIDDAKATVEQAQAALLKKLGEGVEPIAGGYTPRIEAGLSEQDKLRAAATDALLVRGGVNRLTGNNAPALALDLNGNPFRGQTMLDIAKACLRRAGKNPDGMDKREIVAAAFQTTSDFPILLENTMHKALQRAYATAPDTWTRFCATGSVGDFRAHNRYRYGSLGNLDSKNEHGEFKRKAIPDGEKSSVSIGTKGNLIGITRELVINDDLGALINLVTMAGRSARRSIEADVYALLGENGGLGPTMSDNEYLFASAHGNIGTGAALSVASIEGDRVKMASQMDISGNDYLDLRPTVWLGPMGSGGTARVLNAAEYDPDTANKLQRPNMVRGLLSDIVDTPRLTGTRYYLFADPADAPVIEVDFLDGVQEPYLETQNGWNVDGAELKVRLDYGVTAIDYRGAVTNAGTT